MQEKTPIKHCTRSQENWALK